MKAFVYFFFILKYLTLEIQEPSKEIKYPYRLCLTVDGCADPVMIHINKNYLEMFLFEVCMEYEISAHPPI